MEGAEIDADTIYLESDTEETLITVTIEDEEGNAANPGDDVDFATDYCEFEELQSTDEYERLRTAFLERGLIDSKSEILEQGDG